MHYLIYQITNKINGKIYIGKHKTNDINDGYMGSGKYLKASQNHHGIENFEKTILFECSSEEEMNAKEREIVNEAFIAREDTYNIAIGGMGGTIGCWGAAQYFKNKTEEEIKEIRKKAGKAATEAIRNRTEEEKMAFKEKMRKLHGGNTYFLGMHHSEETKRKISEANSKNHSGARNSSYGKMWISNDELKQSKLVKKDYILPEGWVKGRKYNCN